MDSMEGCFNAGVIKCLNAGSSSLPNCQSQICFFTVFCGSRIYQTLAILNTFKSTDIVMGSKRGNDCLKAFVALISDRKLNQINCDVLVMEFKKKRSPFQVNKPDRIDPIKLHATNRSKCLIY